MFDLVHLLGEIGIENLLGFLTGGTLGLTLTLGLQREFGKSDPVEVIEGFLLGTSEEATVRGRSMDFATRGKNSTLVRVRVSLGSETDIVLDPQQ